MDKNEELLQLHQEELQAIKEDFNALPERIREELTATEGFITNFHLSTDEFLFAEEAYQQISDFYNKENNNLSIAMKMCLVHLADKLFPFATSKSDI